MLQQLNKAFILAIALIGVQAFASAIINIEDLRQEGEIGLFNPSQAVLMLPAETVIVTIIPLRTALIIIRMQ